MPNRIFNHTGNLHPRRSAFNLGHSVAYDCGFGEEIPICVMELLPGDTIKGSIDVVGRLQGALVAPIFSQFDIVVEGFTVPFRILQGSDAPFDTPAGEVNWSEFWKGGADGNTDYPLPRLKVKTGDFKMPYFGVGDSYGIQPDAVLAGDDIPLAIYWRAYRWIWNYFYRSEFLQEEIQIAQWLGDGTSSDSSFIDLSDYDAILRRGWRRDYFTSALPFQQFGTSPAINIEGVIPVRNSWPTVGTVEATYTNSGFPSWGGDASFPAFVNNGFTFAAQGVHYNVNGDTVKQQLGYSLVPPASGDSVSGQLNQSVKGNTALPSTATRTASATVQAGQVVDLNEGVGIDMAELRTAWQIQKWMERNARGGVRYSEMLRSHFGVAPSDGFLNNPVYQFGFKGRWIKSEVLQTSASADGSTPQGNQSGQAICLCSGSVGKIRVFEHSLLLVLACIVPKPAYQQGIPKMFTRATRFDFYSPEFAHLAEQPVYNREIYVSGNQAVDDDIFGFQGIWNEYRTIPNRVARHMRSNAPSYSLDYWHQARVFSETPSLNSEFLTIGATEESLTELNRIFAVTDDATAYPFVMHVGNNLTGVRPLPASAEPGLVDHF